MVEITTIEEARAEILRLNEELVARTNERDTLSQNNETMTQELESVRKLNQQYFNKLSAQYSKPDEEPAPELDAPSCEDFARTLDII